MDKIRPQLSAPSNAAEEDEEISIFVKIPDLKIQKIVQQDLTDTIWSFKQHILDTIATKLTDGLNYGIYCPPANGKAGKYLEEERCWKEYPPNDRKEVEVMYKRRIYKNTTFNARKVQEVNDKSGQKKFLAYVKTGNLDKVSKLLNRGLDPNFQDKESGETPFTLAVTLKQNKEMLTTLVSGGAHLDFRTKTGHTPLHRAAQAGNKLAIQILLSFGASPNYKDCKGLTPLYHCVCNKDSPPPDCSKLLLREYALHGVTDDTGWTEIHQACRSGLIGHLRNLIFYGANMNIRNSSGNTPLHICAILKQDDCARLLLRGGADKTLTNFANQDPVAAAIVAGNQSTANLIRDFKPEEAAPSNQETPLYNPKRRTVVWQTQQSDLLRQRRFSHSTPHLSQVDNQVLARPGLPWTDKQRHIPGVEVIEEVDLLYDSDSFSGSFSDVSDEEARDEVNDTAWIKKRWENEHLNIQAHGSLDRFHVTGRDEYQSFLSSSPNANVYRKKPENEEEGVASIRSYPKRLIPSISHPEGVQQDQVQVQVVELRPVASPTSPPFPPRILQAMQSLPTGDSLRPKTLSTFAPLELSGSSPNLLSNKAVRPNHDKPSPLLSPPVGILQRQRQFGSTNDLLRPKDEVSAMGQENRQDVENVRRSALIEPRNNRNDLRKSPGDLEERGHDQFKRSEVVADAGMLHQGQRESLRSYGSAYDLGTGSPPRSGGMDHFGQSKSIAKGGGRQFGSSDDLLNSDRSGTTEEESGGGGGGIEMRTGRKNHPPPPPIRRSHVVPDKEHNKNTGELPRRPRDQRNTYHEGQQPRDSTPLPSPLSPPPPVSRVDSDVDDDDKRSSAPMRHRASTESNASRQSTAAADYRNSLIAAVLKRRQFAEMGNGNPFQTTETEENSATARGQRNSRSDSGSEAQTMDFLQQAQMMLSTLQKRGQTKTATELP